MGLIASSSTVNAVAYLTELGRQYLFNGPNTPRYKTLPNGQTIDLLKIERFSLGDPDVNYNISSTLNLQSGDIPDVSGENENSVKGAKGRTLDHIISPGDSDIPKDDIDTVEYKATHPLINIDLKQAFANLPTVITQQLMTFIDAELVSDGVYNISPMSYGPNKVQNGELIITLKEATLTENGYRLRIFYPTTGMNYNKMTFQFETASANSATISQNVSTVVTNVTTNQII